MTAVHATRVHSHFRMQNNPIFYSYVACVETQSLSPWEHNEPTDVFGVKEDMLRTIGTNICGGFMFPFFSKKMGNWWRWKCCMIITRQIEHSKKQRMEKQRSPFYKLLCCIISKWQIKHLLSLKKTTTQFSKRRWKINTHINLIVSKLCFQ